MSENPLDLLLAKMSEGDSAAAAQAFMAYEPFLRMVVRRQISIRLRAKFDSMDIVQSIWVDLLDGLRKGGWRFASGEHLKAFLVKMTRNRFIDRLRQNRHALEHQKPLLDGDQDELTPSTAQPTASEVVQAGELWSEMLALCPPAHRELLQLKRQGLPLAEIAARTGLHESSVRRILYELAQRLAKHAERLDRSAT